MEDWKKFFIENSSQIWTLVSVIVGGLVTYISTTAVENRKIKRQAQKENLAQVLVPYCTCLETSIDEANRIYQDVKELYGDSGFEKWLNSLKYPFEYLNAAKRVYLSQTAREKLQQYKCLVEYFNEQLEQECTSCLIKYKRYISDKLMPFPNLPQSMHIAFSMDKITNSKIEIALLKQCELSLLNNFTCIDFVRNDDPGNYRNTSISINENIRNTWGAINYGVMDISDVENTDVELSCILLDYIDENISGEKEVLSTIIGDTKSAETLLSITETLNDMVKEIIKTIDSVAK